LKFEFWRIFRVAQPYKSAPKFKFQKEFPLQGRNFVAKMGDENFSGQHTNPFEIKLPLPVAIIKNFLLFFV